MTQATAPMMREPASAGTGFVIFTGPMMLGDKGTDIAGRHDEEAHTTPPSAADWRQTSGRSQEQAVQKEKPTPCQPPPTAGPVTVARGW
jgi:hypothetical protein